MHSCIKLVERAVDAYLTAYSKYIAAIDYVDSKEAQIALLDQAIEWFNIYGKYAGLEHGMRAVNAVDALKKAIEENETLEEDFLLMIESEVQKALWEFILWVKEKCPTRRSS